MDSKLLILTSDDDAADSCIKSTGEDSSYSVYIINEDNEFFQKQNDNTIHQNATEKEFHKSLQQIKHVCELCQKEFRRATLLAAHLKTHNTEFLNTEHSVTVNNALRKVEEIKTKNIYECPECKKKFTSKRKLFIHKKQHFIEIIDEASNKETMSHNEGLLNFKKCKKIRKLLNLKCSDCDSTFTSKKNLATHSKIHKVMFKCDKCEESFYSNNEIKRHVKRVHNVQTCYLCLEEFPDNKKLQYHVKSEHPQKSKCTFCQKSLTRASDLKRHMKLHTGERPFKCDECDRAFTEPTYLKLHKRIHTGEKPHACCSCDKTFRTSSELGKHNRVHTGEKPYKCTICDGKYRTLGQLISHKAVHSDQKEFICSVCGDRFRRSGDLKRHMFKHTSEKPHQCSMCEKRFPRRDSLNAHLRIHTGEKPFTCEECGKSFGQKHILREHRKIHTGIKPFLCSFCGKSFLRIKDTKRHELTHTGEKPYLCKLCGKSFTQNGNLRKHERLHSSMRLNNVLKVVEDALQEMETTVSLQQAVAFMAHTETPADRYITVSSNHVNNEMLMTEESDLNITNNFIQTSDDSNVDIESSDIIEPTQKSILSGQSPYTVFTLKPGTDPTEVREAIPIGSHLRTIIEQHPKESFDSN